jgi:hypothetical protein
MPGYAPHPSPRVAQARLLAEQQAAQMAQRALQSAPIIDPRIMNPAPVPGNGNSSTPRALTPPQPTQGNSPNHTPASAPRPASPKENGGSQAQSIPSISSLVHATDSVSVMSDNKSNSNSSRAGSRSPKENAEQRPKDIPHEKLNIIGEDQRAIRVLDRKFVF